MAKNFWMVVQTPENHEISKGLGFTVHGMTLKQRKRAQRMEPQDGVLFYVKGIKKWTAVASITSKYFEYNRQQVYSIQVLVLYIFLVFPIQFLHNFNISISILSE